MQVLGIIASGRKKGNSSLLLKLALKGAAASGAKTKVINLTDYQLKPCTGCMRCILAEQPCQLKDDMPQIIEQLQGAEGLILAAPTYVLGPAAVTKLALDRFLMVARQVTDSKKNGTAATINTAGLPQWNSLGDSINLLPLAYQKELVDHLVAYGPGPGEPLLEETMADRAMELGRRVVKVWQGEDTKRPAVGNECPHCYSTTFKLGEMNKVHCSLCHATATATLVDGQWKLTYDPHWAVENRFASDKLHHHVHQWIIGSKDRYLAKLPSIIEKGIFS